MAHRVLDHAFHLLVTRPIDKLAATAAVVAFIAVKRLVRQRTRVKPFGPLVYELTRADFGVAAFPWRHLFGEMIPLFNLGPGKASCVWQTAATEAKGDPRASVLTWAGPASYSLMITHPDDVHGVLVDNPNDFERGQLERLLEPLLGKHGLISVLDEKTHATEVQFVLKALSTKKVHRLADTVVHEELTGLLKALLATPPMTPLSLEKKTAETFLAVTVKSVFGSTGSLSVASLQKWLLVPLSPLLALGPDIYNNLPTERNRLAREARRELHATVAPVFASAAAARECEEDEDEGAGPEAQAHTISELLSRCPGISVGQVVDNSATVVAGGYETTASAINWAMVYLTHHPTAQETLFEELRNAVPKGAVPKDEQLRRLPYLTAVVRETLRVTCPATLVSRTVLRDFVLPGSGAFIPKGDTVGVPLVAVHRNKAVYGADAEEFEPERWVREDLYQRVRGKYYYPFGIGTRACVGSEMAYVEMRMAIAMVVRHFRLLWPEGQPMPGRVATIAVHPTIRCLNLLEPRGE